MNLKLVRARFPLHIWSKNGTSEKLIIVSTLCFFIYASYTLITKERIEIGDFPDSAIENQKYLINTTNCRIPDVDPFSEEVLRFVRKERYMECTDLGLLSYIYKADGEAILKINSSLLPVYSAFEIQCCYSKIYRYNYFNRSDDDVWYSRCIEFEGETVITHAFIKVECKSLFHIVYSNVHAVALPIKVEGPSKDARKKYFSVLLMAIDSISKLNLRRAMPKTHAYLEKHFLGMRGYSKIGDNTFPNLMAILTGKNYDQLDVTCGNEVKQNDCGFIWDTFKSSGYLTGYAEDESEISTFNYNRPGFREPPTDYYYRPYFSASEKLVKFVRHSMTYCSGPETSGERVLNAAKDFVINFKEVPSFGLFWMNSFSHEDINMPSAMDGKVLEFLSDAGFRSALENTVMLFFSDHGFRFGDIRYTHTGWLEERLPFMYVYLPERFKRNFGRKYENLTVNAGRLVTPYDVYCTLQEVLAMGNSSYKVKKSTGCPNCRSMFAKISEKRNCKEVGIDQHWCTCTGHKKVSTAEPLVAQVAHYVVRRINEVTKAFKEGRKCSRYNLRNVVTAGMSERYTNEKNQTVRYFLVIIETTPKAMFEATVETQEYSTRRYFKLLGDISRINRYKKNSDCVKSGALKKYCHCDGMLRSMKSAICSALSC